MSRHWAWQTLGIAPTSEAGTIRRAYADKLRSLDIDRDAAAYAALREARDWALRWARDNPGAEADEPAAPLADSPAADGAPEDDPDDWDDLDGVELHFEMPLPQGLTFSAPRLEVVSEAPGGAGVVLERDHDRKLHALLYANGDSDDTAFTPEELAEAQRHLAAILQEAEGGNLAAHDAIESWLALTLAGAWPRCAPLLEAAEASFQWSRQRGQLGERPAVAFLNDRLRGMRFEAKVLDPAHPLHKAWNELTQPGRAGAFKTWRVSRQDVQQLLQGVRSNFPELEHRFDPLRVASWEGSQASSSDSSGGPGIWLWVFLFLAFSRVVGSFDDNRRPLQTAADPLVIEIDPATTALAVSTIFGPGKTIDWLKGAQPEMALMIESNLRESKRVGDDQGRTLVRVLGLVRERAYRARDNLSGRDLDMLMRIRHNQLVMARSVSAPTCLLWMKGMDYKSIGPLPGKQESEEQAYYAAQVAAQGLHYALQSKGSNASVPGELVGRVIDATRISEDRVRAAMQGKGSAADSCAVHIALIAETLRWKGAERTAILKVL